MCAYSGIISLHVKEEMIFREMQIKGNKIQGLFFVCFSGIADESAVSIINYNYKQLSILLI